MTPEEKIAHVENQISGPGEVKHIDCPFCGEVSISGEFFCCSMLMKAVQAILDRQVQEALAEDAARICAKIAKTGMN